MIKTIFGFFAGAAAGASCPCAACGVLLMQPYPRIKPRAAVSAADQSRRRGLCELVFMFHFLLKKQPIYEPDVFGAKYIFSCSTNTSLSNFGRCCNLKVALTASSLNRGVKSSR